MQARVTFVSKRLPDMPFQLAKTLREPHLRVAFDPLSSKDDQPMPVKRCSNAVECRGVDPAADVHPDDLRAKAVPERSYFHFLLALSRLPAGYQREGAGRKPC